MDLINELRADLNKGFSKSDLERLIGLPKKFFNRGLKRNPKLSKKGEAKVSKFMSLPKPDPFNLPCFPKKENNIQDLNDKTDEVKPEKPAGSKKSNFKVKTKEKSPKSVNSVESPITKDPKFGLGVEPAEGTNRFFLKYGAFTHAEAAKLNK